MNAAVLQSLIAAEVASLGETLTLTTASAVTYTITAIVSICPIGTATEYFGTATINASVKPIWLLLMDGVQATRPAATDFLTYNAETLHVLGTFDQDLSALRMTRMVFASSSAS